MNPIEMKLYGFVRDYIDYLRQNQDNFVLNIYTSNDMEAMRNNAGWYQYNNGHIINLNVYNLACSAGYIGNGLVDIDSFFALATLIVGHEYRHYSQGKCIYDGVSIDGFTNDDAIAAHLMMYIRYFFDAYYLLNKGHIKYEVDAEKFGVVEGVKFLNAYNPGMDAKRAMKNAVNFYANLVAHGFGEPTLPENSKSYDEIVRRLEFNLNNNTRNNNLGETLKVYRKQFYDNHDTFGLDKDKVITDNLLKEYQNLDNGFDKDLLVANRILEVLHFPEESLEQFGRIKQLYNGKMILK